MNFYDDKVINTKTVDTGTDLRRRVKHELLANKECIFLKDPKANLNVRNYWRENKEHYPLFFKAAEACLHVPATLIPVKIMFPAAGNAVIDHRTKHISENMSLIFLEGNAQLVHEMSVPI